MFNDSSRYCIEAFLRFDLQKCFYFCFCLIPGKQLIQPPEYLRYEIANQALGFMFDTNNKSALSDREIFTVFFKNKSIAKTADTLGTYPSTVSRSIRSLENHLDIKLLGKAEGRISLTEEGMQYGNFIEKKIEEIRNFEKNLSRKLIEIDIIATEWLLNNIAIPSIPKDIKEDINVKINFSSSANLNNMKHGKPTIFIGSIRDNNKTDEMLLKNISTVNVGLYAPADCAFIDFNKTYTNEEIKQIPVVNVVDGTMRSVIRFEGQNSDDFQNSAVMADAFHTAFAEGMSRGYPFVSSHCVIRDAVSHKKCFKIKTVSKLEPVYIDVIFSKIENHTFLTVARSIHEYGKKLLSYTEL